MNHKPIRLLCAALLAASGLSACNGGDDDASPVPVPLPVETEVPASAAASPEAYSRYALGLKASESAEPLGLDKVAEAPGSETAEPLDLN